MSAKYMVPQKKDNLSMPLKIAGMAGGAMAGGLPGAMAGAQLGQAAGGMINNPRDPNNALNVGMAGAGTVSTAMNRRAQALEGDSFETLKQSIQAVPQLPPEVRTEVARPLLQAYVTEARTRGRNPWEGMG